MFFPQKRLWFYNPECGEFILLVLSDVQATLRSTQHGNLSVTVNAANMLDWAFLGVVHRLSPTFWWLRTGQPPHPQPMGWGWGVNVIINSSDNRFDHHLTQSSDEGIMED